MARKTPRKEVGPFKLLVRGVPRQMLLACCDARVLMSAFGQDWASYWDTALFCRLLKRTGKVILGEFYRQLLLKLLEQADSMSLLKDFARADYLRLRTTLERMWREYRPGQTWTLA